MIGKYQLDQIYNADCYKAIKDIPDNSIDLIITDPPYLMDEHGGDHLVIKIVHIKMTLINCLMDFQLIF